MPDGAQRRQLLEESRLLDLVLDLVHRWQCRPPRAVLDAVLRGAQVVPLPAQRAGLGR